MKRTCALIVMVPLTASPPENNQRAPNPHNAIRACRHDTDQTHPKLQPHTGVMTRHTGTNTPKFVPSWDDCPLTYSRWAVRIWVVSEQTITKSVPLLRGSAGVHGMFQG